MPCLTRAAYGNRRTRRRVARCERALSGVTRCSAAANNVRPLLSAARSVRVSRCLRMLWSRCVEEGEGDCEERQGQARGQGWHDGGRFRRRHAAEEDEEDDPVSILLWRTTQDDVAFRPLLCDGKRHPEAGRDLLGPSEVSTMLVTLRQGVDTAPLLTAFVVAGASS